MVAMTITNHTNHSPLSFIAILLIVIVLPRAERSELAKDLIYFVLHCLACGSPLTQIIRCESTQRCLK